MGRSWALQDAKNRLSEVVDRAGAEGPQVVTRRGEAVAVVLSMADYQQLSGRVSDAFVDFLLSAPTHEDFQVERSADAGRAIDLS
jgi:prevent-host-death family protein